jgi:hypothetical protein
MKTDTSERGLEDLIVRAMTGRIGPLPPDEATEISPPLAGGTGWVLGNPSHPPAALQPRRTRALDLALFINGLPVATFELKNSLTKQTVDDARSNTSATAIPARRCSSLAAAWCISRWTTARCGCAPHLKGQGLVVPALQPGLERRRRQPPNPDGLKTDYLWKRILTPAG